MNKDEWSALLAEIGGGPVVGIQSLRERELAEQVALDRHAEEMWGVLVLGEAAHQFYRDSLEVVRQKILVVDLDDKQYAMINWHIVSFERFAVAVKLMSRAYYFEAMVLARDLWEIALSLAALQRNVVTLAQLLGSGARGRRELERASRDMDALIRRVLLQENQALDTSAHEAIETFLGLVNLATHKSRLHWGSNLKEILSEGSTSIFPRFDKVQAEVTHNTLYLASWSLISTLPYLDFALNSDGWMKRYGKVQLAFREGVGRGPNPTVQAWPAILRHVFGVGSKEEKAC